MSGEANDKFVEYYTEKIWEMIPAFYRGEDGLAVNPDVLRSVVKILAGNAAHLRRSGDELWDDQFIDLCRNWAVPYLADLVATRLISRLNPRGRRVDVAKTIYYRRRKGTLRVLEELISDITEWEGVVTEAFRRLARPWHGLDPNPLAYAGRFTGTLPGSWADLRRPQGTQLVNGPYDEFAHYADERRARGLDGMYNIPKILFFLYRIPSIPLTGVRPKRGPNARSFSFDPSGRDIPLFSLRNRESQFDWDQWRSLDEWELPAPIRCRVLGHAEYVFTPALIAQLPVATRADLAKLRGVRLRSESLLLRAIAGLPAATSATLMLPVNLKKILRGALVQNCGKSVLLESGVAPGSTQPKSIHLWTAPGTEVPSDKIVSANLNNPAWNTTAPGKTAAIDPQLGRVRFLAAAPPNTLRVDYCYGFPASIGAGGFDRSPLLLPPAPPALSGGGAIAAADIHAAGVTEISDSDTYGPAANKTSITTAQIQARNFQRPYVALNASWSLNTGLNTNSELTIEGLWIGATGAFLIRLLGDWETVTLRHVTLDPGGIDAQGDAIPALTLSVEGDVRTLRIFRSITGPIQVAGGGILEKLVVRDSIVHSLDQTANAIDTPDAKLEIVRSTILGGVRGKVLDASEALITGYTEIDDTQHGCFRFSAALDQTGPPIVKKARVPHPYESYLIPMPAYYFTSQRFGDPGYVQLSQGAPVSLQRGAENGSEIGAYSSLRNPIRLDGLRAKVDEYLPFGLIPVFLFET